jgi:hypothetical protein
MHKCVILSICLAATTRFTAVFGQDSALHISRVNIAVVADSVHPFSPDNISVLEEGVFPDYGRVSAGIFHPISHLIDSNVNVVVLEDVGKTELQGYFFGWRVKFMRYRRLLIRNKKGFEAAKITLFFDEDENGARKLPSLRASTWNLEGGKVVQTKVDTADMFVQDGEERFSFSNVREGSIVEYTYSVYSGSIYSLRPWDFQGEYPRLKSDYTVSFPAAFNYVFSTQGAFAIPRSVDSSRQTFSIGLTSYQGLKYTIHWSMNDVPAFEEEPYIFCRNSHVCGVRFQLSEYTNMQTLKRTRINDQWKVLNDKLFKNKAFGGVMNTSKHWERRELRMIVDDTAAGQAKARAVFAYVRDHFMKKDGDIFYGGRPLKEIFKSREGNVAEINLMLTAMLREEGLSADAVILSTRENGLINPYYPLTENFNYVVVRLRMDGKEYFLDASEPKMGFGRLPLECYNGYARAVSERPDSAVLNTDSVVETKFSSFFLADNEAGDGITGDYTGTQGYYRSEDIRNEIDKDGETSYFEGIRKAFPFDVRITDKHVDSLKEYDLPVTVRYTVDFSKGGEDHLYINPMMGESIKYDPFSAANRNFPIEMPSAQNEMYVFQMTIPKGYVVEELPKSVKVLLNETEGSYEYRIASDGQNIQLRSVLILKRTHFDPEDYPTLRDFFAAVVKKQGEVIVFRKN